MINETFVASNPKDAYAQAVEKYGKEVPIVSAKQVMSDTGDVHCEVVITVATDLFKEKSFAGTSFSAYTAGTENSEESEGDEEVLMSEIDALKSELESMKDELSHSVPFASETTASRVKTLFKKKGVSPLWLDSICNTLAGSPLLADESLLVSYLLEEIDEALKVKEEDLSVPKLVMLVGPTGVGKTTTIAKLAARYAYLMDRPYKVALLNLDSYKVGAIEQLEHYADIMQIEYVTVSSTARLEEAFERLEGYDVILMDTAGMSPYDTRKFVKMIAYVNHGESRNIEVNLVISATVKYEDMEDIYSNFSFLNLDGLIITKFDETKHFGTLLNFMLMYDLPMAYFSTGQEVPDDLLVADKEYLLERFIGDVNEG